VFRERPRRKIELHNDGSLVFPPSFRKKSDRVVPMERGVKVIASGDRVCFCHPDGEQVAHAFLPWIGAAERKELTRRFQQMVGEPLRPENARENAARAAFSYPIP